MALLSPLLFASSLFMAGVENPVYLAKFENKQQEIKISKFKEELMANWMLCQNQEMPFKIEPLS